MLYHTPATRLVSRMPFEGKKLVTAHYRRGLQAIRLGDRGARDKEVRELKRFSNKHYAVAGIAGAFALVNTFHAVRSGSAVHGFDAAYDAAFATAHYGSGYVQAHIARHLGKQHVPDPRYARSRPIPGINTGREYDITPAWYQTMFTQLGALAFSFTALHAMRPELEMPQLPALPAIFG